MLALGKHLNIFHKLSMRLSYHAQDGGASRIIERGVKGRWNSCLRFVLFSIGRWILSYCWWASS